MFHQREDQSGESIWERVKDIAHGDVDPHAGSQGHVLAGDAPVAGPGHQLADFASEWDHEGFGAVLDPAGAADRLAARRELASRFNVMPDGTAGVAHENQVSEKEFDQIAREYSDIRLGRTDLQMGTKPAGMSDADYATFRGGAMNDLADIMQTESGRGLVDSLAHAPLQADGVSHRTTTINPFLDATNTHVSNANSEGGGTFGQSGYIKVAPGQDIAPGADNLRSDVTMYHEMVHANRAVYNEWDQGTVGTFHMFGMDFSYADPDKGIGEKEHQAAGLGLHAQDRFSENRYRGERREIGNLGVGARTAGAETDANMTHRDTYTYPGHARTTPAFDPG